MTQRVYVPVSEAKYVAICPECGSLIHSDYTGKHDEWHLNVLRGSLQK